MHYSPVIGMEVHVELRTESKMFCSCKNGLGQETNPNEHICPVCTGQPGTLPVPNAEAIRFVHMVGLALGCSVRLHSKFDRKNYFYPDLPKGYQISQYDEPLVENGHLEVEGKQIGITRVHMEEDTGKSTHRKDLGATLVDFNRAGVPLMELVTEPDIESAEQAKKFCQKLQQILRYLRVSDADMEKGQMRCEANISLYGDGQERLSGTKVEVKNLNSFKIVEKAITFEIGRQRSLLERGERVIQETRGWDETKSETVSQRLKESAHDYRYFPEPDIPSLVFTQAYVDALSRSLPELPDARRRRFEQEYELPPAVAEQLTSDKADAEFFEQVASEIHEKIASGESKSDFAKTAKIAANYFITEIRRHFATDGKTAVDLSITPENFAEFAGIVQDGKINSSAAQTVLEEMYRTGGDPSNIIEEKNLTQINDDTALQTIIDAVISANEKSVADYRSGKTSALQYLVGQVMKETKGKANPQAVLALLQNVLDTKNT